MARDICPSCGSHTALGDQQCFKCGYRQHKYVFSYKDMTTSTDANGRTIALNARIQCLSELEYNPNRFHPDALEWLNKSYIFNGTITKQHIAYVPKSHQVYIPALDKDGAVRFYQVRNLTVNEEKPKYLTYGKSSDYLIHYKDHPKKKEIVIVEDHLSAIRLREHTNVVALSGTHLSKSNIELLLKQYNSFIFWLDPDLPGKKALFKNLKILQESIDTYTCKMIFSASPIPDYHLGYIDYTKIQVDPKCIRSSRIVNILKNEVLTWGTL